MSSLNLHEDYDYEEENPFMFTLIIPWIMLSLGAAIPFFSFSSSDASWYYHLMTWFTPVVILACIISMFSEYLRENFKAGPWYLYLVIGFLLAIGSPILVILIALLLGAAWFVGRLLSNIYQKAHS